MYELVLQQLSSLMKALGTGLEAGVDSLMASVPTDTSKSFTVHLKTNKGRSKTQSFSRDRKVVAWHVVCHIRTSRAVNLSLATGGMKKTTKKTNHVRLRRRIKLKSKKEKPEGGAIFDQ